MLIEVLSAKRRTTLLLVSALIASTLAWVAVGSVILKAIEPAAVTKISDLEVANQIQMTSSTGAKILSGTGDPSGSVTAPAGSIRIRTDAPLIYRNISGGTTWNSFKSTLIAVQKFTGASGTYTPSAGTRRVHLMMTGAGGGGGAAQSGGAGTASFGAGGSSGTYVDIWIAPGTTITGGTWTGSATGGAGGTGGTGAGSTGTDATISIQSTTYTAKGGPGGGGMATSSSPATTAFAWLAPNTSGPSDFIVASPGTPGARYANGVGDPGSGGSNPFGGGAGVTTYPTDGANAIGFGGGGGGAVAWNTGDKAGGNGSPTLIIVEEHSQ